MRCPSVFLEQLFYYGGPLSLEAVLPVILYFLFISSLFSYAASYQNPQPQNDGDPNNTTVGTLFFFIVEITFPNVILTWTNLNRYLLVIWILMLWMIIWKNSLANMDNYCMWRYLQARDVGLFSLLTGKEICLSICWWQLLRKINFLTCIWALCQELCRRSTENVKWSSVERTEYSIVMGP